MKKIVNKSYNLIIKPFKFFHVYKSNYFKWLADEDIGDLPEEWNWLDGYSSSKIDAKNVHFTRGGPWFRDKSWKPKTNQDEIYSNEWIDLKKNFLKEISK